MRRTRLSNGTETVRRAAAGTTVPYVISVTAPCRIATTFTGASTSEDDPALETDPASSACDCSLRRNPQVTDRQRASDQRNAETDR